MSVLGLPDLDRKLLQRLRQAIVPWLYAAALILLAVVAFAVAVLVPPPRCEDVPGIAIGEVMLLGGCDR
jgi:hypothetical protein